MDTLLENLPAVLITSVMVIISIYYLFKSKSTGKVSLPDKSEVNKKKKQHQATFVRAEVLTICKGKIHVAIGYGLANAIILEGENGCVLIDTTESHETAMMVLEALKAVIKGKPVEAIILTHFHPDHTLGLDVFLEAYPGAQIFAHETLFTCFQGLFNVSLKATSNRSAYQFGTRLSQKDQENAGIGLKLK